MYGTGRGTTLIPPLFMVTALGAHTGRGDTLMPPLFMYTPLSTHCRNTHRRCAWVIKPVGATSGDRPFTADVEGTASPRPLNEETYRRSALRRADVVTPSKPYSMRTSVSQATHTLMRQWSGFATWNHIAVSPTVVVSASPTVCEPVCRRPHTLMRQWRGFATWNHIAVSPTVVVSYV